MRRQFRERPGILAGTETPDYARCVDIVTRGTLRRMVVPGLVAVGVPTPSPSSSAGSSTVPRRWRRS